ncbi:MAG: cytochrome P450 [Chloroflexota bacterium]
MSALRDQIVDGFKDEIRSMVNDLIDTMPDKGVVDFCAAFADPIPARVLGPMLGIPYEDIPEFNEWIRIGGRKVDALRSGDGIQEVEDANRNMHNYVREMLRERRNNLGDDVFSELIAAEIDGDRLTEVELVSLAGELASAGVDTTRAQLPLTLYELLNHPDQFALLQNDPSLAAAAVEEGMRYAPLPFALPHAALRDHEYRGISLKEGDIALIFVPATNRDPAAMENPNVFDITRKRARHFSFGYGPHFCTGAQLARMEMTIALETLVKRIRSWRLVAEPPRDPVTKGHTPQELLIEIEKR